MSTRYTTGVPRPTLAFEASPLLRPFVRPHRSLLPLWLFAAGLLIGFLVARAIG